MAGMMKKATPSPKPTVAGLKKMNLDKTAGTQSIKKMNLDKTATAKPKPKVTASAKPKATPTPKFTPPTVSQFKQSAAYKAGDWTYKQYVDEFRMQYNAKYKKR
jgi:hypothetical protein